MEKIIEVELRDFKRKKSVIETTLSRVEAYRQAIGNPESFSGIMPGNTREVGMPKGSCSIGSEVEKIILDKEQAVTILTEWIKDDLSRIYPLQVEAEQIEGALGALNSQQRYIVQCKYIENMFWRDIEHGFNEKFKNDNYIGYERLKKMNKEGLIEITKILEVFYSRIYGKSE